MSELLALCFDSDASPSITLKDTTRRPGETDLPFGWGFGWYPGGELAAVVIKDPTSTGDDPMTHVLRDWDRFRSTLFLCHLRGAAKRISQRDAQPFIKSYAGRMWLFAHSGDLQPGFEQAFPTVQGSAFEPLGRTDSEQVFCWMLEELLRTKTRSLAQLGAEQLHSWLRTMSRFGTANVLISDGEQLAVYRGSHDPAPLHWLRRLPPHPITRLESDVLTLDLANPKDPHRTGIVFSSSPLSHDAWQEMAPGQLLLARRGELIWISTGIDDGSKGLVLGPTPSVPEAPHEYGRTMRIVHETAYSYETPVERSSHRFRLRPVQDVRQDLLDFELQISVDGMQRNYEDVFGNWTTALEISEPFSELLIRSSMRVRVHAESPMQIRSPDQHDSIPLVWMPWQRQMMWPYLLPPELPESQLRELSDYAMSFVERNDYDLLETLLDMNKTIYRDFEYVAGSTHLATTAFDVYSTRRGVCQDFTNLLICMARLLSVPARYRMGYIHTGADYGNKIQSEASHAWVELYLPWVGWHGLDPTNGCQVNLDHIRVATGRNFIDSTPTSGVLYKGGGRETLTTSVRVVVEETEERTGER